VSAPHSDTIALIVPYRLSFQLRPPHRASHSFPTRRSSDLAFLRDHTVPLLKEIALFYEDFLIEGPDGKYEFIPSYSPENTPANRSEEHTSELQSRENIVCRLLLEKINQ